MCYAAFPELLALHAVCKISRNEKFFWFYFPILVKYGTYDQFFQWFLAFLEAYFESFQNVRDGAFCGNSQCFSAVN